MLNEPHEVGALNATSQTFVWVAFLLGIIGTLIGLDSKIIINY